MSKGYVWVVDDDSSIRWVMEKTLSSANIKCETFSDAESVLMALERETPDVLVSDIRMPGIDGIELLNQVHASSPELPIIIMTAHSDLDAAVNAYQKGAFEYLPKPFDVDETLTLVERAIAHSQEQKREHSDHITNADDTPEIIGEAPAMQEVFRAIGRLSRSSISVLINGESGTGKELVAHALHRHSPRSQKPFIALNMAAIPKDLIESELFSMKKEPLLVPTMSDRAALNKQMVEHYFLMKLVTCHWISRHAYSEYLPTVSFTELGVIPLSKLTSELLPQHIKTLRC